MTSILREDVYRSLLFALTSAASMAGKSVRVTGLAQETRDLTEWYDFQFISMQPEDTRHDHLLAFGTVRVVCNSRPGPNATTYDYTAPYAQADAVVAALERRDVKVLDYSTGSGTVLRGIASTREVSVDDLNDTNDGVRPILCTVEFQLSAPEA